MKSISLPDWLPSLRALSGTLGGEWERERRDTLFLMAAIGLAVLPSFAQLPLWCSAGFCVLFLWRLGLVFSGNPLPGGGIRLVTAAACTVGVIAQYDTLFGRDSGVSLLVLFLGLKLMEMRARRDVYVVIFLCFFLLLTGFFQSQSLLVAGLTVLAITALIAALLTVQFGAREASVRRRLGYTAVLLLQALPLAAALFLLFPRLSTPLWGLPDDAHAGRTGMSDTMTPGQISKLARDETVAFRVQFDGDAPAPSQMYWRGPTLGDYDGQTWRPVRYELTRPTAPRIDLPATGNALHYLLTLEPHGRRWLFALDVPVEVPAGQGLSTSLSPEFDALSLNPLVARTRYRAAARTDAAIGLNETRLSLQNWIQLPPGHHRRTLELAARWRQEEPDNLRLVKRALSMFRDAGFRYTLNPPLLADDVVDRFLFETRAGFCEHFAGAFVVLMRALDIPARVVTGYQGAEVNPEGGYWIVRQADAHAWAEVWLADRGWVRIDPTSAVAPQRIEQGARSVEALRDDAGLLPAFADFALARQWRLSFDAMANSWNQWVLNYDRNRQRSFLSSLGLDAADPRELLGALGIVLGLVIGAIALSTLRPRRARDPVEASYEHFCERLAQLGTPRQRDETAVRFVRRVDRLLDGDDARQAREIVAVYNRLRYDPGSSTPDRVRQFQRLVKQFRPS
jgi:transglutaminase-like putative cysteine protease